MTNVYAVIMAGGAGTRFWPASRRSRPKQFLSLGRDTSMPLIAATVRRISPLVPVDRTLVVTSAALADATRNALPHVPAENILLEPVGRNTAPCVAWATAWVARKNPQGILCALPADAYISDDLAFVKALETAVRAAAHGWIVTLGITPTRPETGYGYLHVGEPTEVPGVHRVRAFVEKPDAARAQKYLDHGDYLWNAGIFVFRADVMNEALATHLPAVAEATRAFDHAAREGCEFEEVVKRYPSLPNVSIDYGVMEKVGSVAVVPTDCGWSDVGSWQAAWELGDKDPHGNVVRTDAQRTVLVDAKGNYVMAPTGKAVALIGLEDLVVVDTPDALLVMPRARAQEVKKAVETLNERGETEVL